MKKTVFVIVALALAACATTALAQGPNPAPPAGGFAGPPGAGMMGGGMGTCPAMVLSPPPAGIVDRADALQLADGQKTKLKDVLTKSEETLMPLRQKAGEASRALRQAIFAPEFDASKIKQLVTDAQNAEVAILKAEIGIWGQIRGILTADQLAKLQELTGRRMGPGMGGGRRGGPGGQPAPPPPAQ